MAISVRHASASAFESWPDSPRIGNADDNRPEPVSIHAQEETRQHPLCAPVSRPVITWATVSISNPERWRAVPLGGTDHPDLRFFTFPCDWIFDPSMKHKQHRVTVVGSHDDDLPQDFGDAATLGRSTTMVWAGLPCHGLAGSSCSSRQTELACLFGHPESPSGLCRPSFAAASASIGGTLR